MIEKNASVTWKISENLLELQEEEIIFKNEVSLRDFWDNMKHNSMWIFGVPEVENTKKYIKKVKNLKMPLVNGQT